jgi:hypothetical protein
VSPQIVEVQNFFEVRLTFFLTDEIILRYFLLTVVWLSPRSIVTPSVKLESGFTNTFRLKNCPAT